MALELISANSDFVKFPSGLDELSKGKSFIISFYVAATSSGFGYLMIENRGSKTDYTIFGIDKEGFPYCIFEADKKTRLVASKSIKELDHVCFLNTPDKKEGLELKVFINGVGMDLRKVDVRPRELSQGMTIKGYGVLKDLEVFSPVEKISPIQIFRKPHEILLRATNRNCQVCYLFGEGSYYDASTVFDYSLKERHANFYTSAAGNYVVNSFYEVGFITGHNNYNEYGYVQNLRLEDNIVLAIGSIFRLSYFLNSSVGQFVVVSGGTDFSIYFFKEHLTIQLQNKKWSFPAKQFFGRFNSLQISRTSEYDYHFLVNDEQYSIKSESNIYVENVLSKYYQTTLVDSFVFKVELDQTLIYDCLSDLKNRSLKKLRVFGPYHTDLLGVRFKSLRYKPIEKRLALIIGNANYIDQSDKLNNSLNDAQDIDRSLRTLGFDCFLCQDSTLDEMKKAIVHLFNEVKKYEIVVIYYAGHALQINGVNFLLPVDAKMERTSDLMNSSISITTVIENFQHYDLKNTIIIMDSCRENQFTKKHKNSLGLVDMSAPQGTIIAYSTTPGKQALDGLPGSRNGVYTEALKRNLPIPNLSIEAMFKRVRKEVYDKTNGQQIPWESSSLVEDFYFH